MLKFISDIIIQLIPFCLSLSNVTHRTMRQMLSSSHMMPPQNWSSFLIQVFLSFSSPSQVHQRCQQMGQFYQTERMSSSSHQCRVHQTALPRPRLQQLPHQSLQFNKTPWFRLHLQFTFRLSPSLHIPSFFTNHRLCLTDPSGHHIQSHPHNCQSNIRRDFHQHRRETHRVLRLIHQRQITKLIRQLNWIQQTITHRTHRQTILTMNTLTLWSQLLYRSFDLPCQPPWPPQQRPTQQSRSIHRHVRFHQRSNANSKRRRRRSWTFMRKLWQMVQAHPTPN